MKQKTWNYMRRQAKALQAEVDDQLQVDGDRLKHARATDLIRAFHRILNDGIELERYP